MSTDPSAAEEPADPTDAPLGAGIDFADPNSKLAPLYASLSGIVGVLVVGAGFALYNLQPLMHTDVWTHLAHGRWIAEHGFPEHEPLSPFTDHDAVMYHQCWLSQVIYHGAWSWGQAVGGDDRAARFIASGELVRLLHVFAATGMLAALWVAFRRAGNSGAIASLGVVLVVVFGVVALGLYRPQIFGQMLFAVFLAMLSRPVFSKAATVAAPLLLVLWANLHGSFALGFVLLGFGWLGRVIETKRGAVTDPGVRRLTLAILLGLAGVCLNPAGPKIYLNVLSFGRNENLKTLLEWKPLWDEDNRPSLVVFAALWVGVIVLQLLARTRLRPQQYLALALFGLAPLALQQRLNTWWLLVAVWTIVPLFSAAAARWKLVLPRSVPSLRKTALVVLAAVPFLLLAGMNNPLFGERKEGSPPPFDKVYAVATPRELTAALADPGGNHGPRMKPLDDALGEWKAKHPDQPLGPVLCSPEIGELLFWKSADGGPPPVRFTHAHLFPPDHWAACEAAEKGDGWEEFTDRLKANVIAVEAGARDHQKLMEEVGKSGRWKVVLNEKTGPPRARLFVAVKR